MRSSVTLGRMEPPGNLTSIARGIPSNPATRDERHPTTIQVSWITTSRTGHDALPPPTLLT